MGFWGKAKFEREFWGGFVGVRPLVAVYFWCIIRLRSGWEEFAIHSIRQFVPVSFDTLTNSSSMASSNRCFDKFFINEKLLAVAPVTPTKTLL